MPLDYALASHVRTKAASFPADPDVADPAVALPANYVSGKEADGLGGEKAPDVEWVKSTDPDPETRDTVEHIRGIDPEWSYNPGEALRRG